MRIDFGHRQRARFAESRDLVQQIEGQVRIAAQAQSRTARFARHLLHQHVDAVRCDRARDMGVVQAGIVLLRLRRIELRAGLQVELLDPHVRRQGIGALRQRVFQAGEILAEMPVDERLQEAPLQAAARRRWRERQRRVDLQRTVGVIGDRIVDRVEQAMRFADAERRGDAQAAARMPQNFRDGFVQRGGFPHHHRRSSGIFR